MNTDPGYTYFGTATPARIDYVFVEKFMQDHLIDVRVMETEASDHYGGFSHFARSPPAIALFLR